MENLNKEVDFWENRIKVVSAAYKKLNSVMDAAIDAGSMDIDGPLFNGIYNGFEELISLVDESEFIDWFIRENDFGERKGSVFIGHENPVEFVVSNERDLAEVVVTYREYKKTL